MEVKREIFVADEKVVEGRLEELRQRAAQLQPAEEGYAAATTDFVSIDFVGYIDNEPFENGAGQDYLLELGSGRFIPGFEDQIVGMKVGEERRIKVTFPEAYGFAPLAGKDAEFDITVKEIKSTVFPELDDDFAKEMGEFETFDALKAKMSEVYEQQEKERIEAQVRERLVQALIEANPVELPETAVQRQLGYLLDDAKNRLAQQKLTLEMMGMDEENFKRDYRPVAETQVSGSLLLSAVARKEGLKVGDEDITAHVNELVARTGQNAEQIGAFYRNNANARDNLIAQLVEDKAITFIAERAKIVEVSREELFPKEEASA
jgi:trigger factor